MDQIVNHVQSFKGIFFWSSILHYVFEANGQQQDEEDLSFA